MTPDDAPPVPPPEKPPSPDAVDAWIERRVATIREDRERMREVREVEPWARFTAPF